MPRSARRSDCGRWPMADEPPFICPECGATYDDQPQTGCMFDGTPVERVGSDGQTNGVGRPTDDGLGYG